MKSFSKKGKEKQSEAIAPAALPSEESTELAEAFSLAMAQAELRLTGIYGDISEEKCSEAVYGLLTLSNTAVDQENPLPIEFYVSSHGGQATEMFSVYDVMRAVREKVPIHTYGIGKVMSAGVLLLAAGTPGERRIGRNCRVMIHGVVAGQHGHIADIENEFSETKMTQKKR